MKSDPKKTGPGPGSPSKRQKDGAVHAGKDDLHKVKSNSKVHKPSRNGHPDRPGSEGETAIGLEPDTGNIVVILLITSLWSSG